MTTKTTVKTVFLNDGTPVRPEVMVENGFQKLTIIDRKYIEVIDAEAKSHLRTYYLTKSGEGHFYLNDTRYKVVNFRQSLPYAKEKEVQQPQEKKEEPSRTKEIDFKKPEAPAAPKGPVRHKEYETIKVCIDQDIPVYLVGDAGTGKNHTLQEIAEDLGLTFYFTNSVQQEYKLTGFIDAGGKYHETEFYRAFTQGGLFFLDEIDASIPEVLVLLNAAIANRYFEFPNGRVDAHPQFRVVAAGNTVGSGANELYTGRLVLDSATLDRFAVIEFDYDRNIEMALAKGNVELVNFVRSLRKFCRENGIRGTFSYRMLISVTKLEAAGIPLDKVVEIAVTKGLDRDTIKTIKVENAGKYYYALQKVQNRVG